VEIPSIGVAIAGDRTAALRTATPKPVIARVDDDRTILDLRTVDPSDDLRLVAALGALG
jgi:L-seryl-tRNA(Ser) seleniumtransferase